MPNRLSRTVVLVLLTSLVSACSWFKEKPPEYINSPDVDPLSVPEDLDAPRYYAPITITAPPMRTPTGDELNPGPPRVASTGGRPDTNAYMAWSAEGVYLQVKDSPDSVARRLRFAIERSGMIMLERDDGGSYRFEYVQMVMDDRSFWQKMAFWKGKPNNYSGIYRTRVVPDGEEARVFLLFDSGDPATTTSAEHVLGIFMERLG